MHTGLQECISALQAGWKDAKARHHQRTLQAIYGHSKLSMYRAKTRFLYQSNAFQLMTAFFIIAGFLVDVAESQVRVQFDLMDSVCLSCCLSVCLSVYMPILQTL